jgi:hypothetical protein
MWIRIRNTDKGTIYLADDGCAFPMQEASEFGQTSEEAEVCADLITHFSTLFHVDADELEKVRFDRIKQRYGFQLNVSVTDLL